jgi:hypothetical protein
MSLCKHAAGPSLDIAKNFHAQADGSRSRIDAALAVAARVPWRVERADAPDWVERQLDAEPIRGGHASDMTIVRLDQPGDNGGEKQECRGSGD